MAKALTNEAIEKKLPEFCDEVRGLQIDELRTRIGHLEAAIVELAEKKEADEELKNLREKIKDLAAVYRPTEERTKITYLIRLLKEKGGA